jgi:hypothetical protein
VSLVIIVCSYISLVSHLFDLGDAAVVLVESLQMALAARVVILSDVLSSATDCLVSWAKDLSAEFSPALSEFLT